MLWFVFYWLKRNAAGRIAVSVIEVVKIIRDKQKTFLSIRAIFFSAPYDLCQRQRTGNDGAGRIL